MIQRIQSLYLLAGGGLLLVFALFADVWAAGVPLGYDWLVPAGYTLAFASAAVALGAVFFYKSRPQQRMLITAAQWLTVVLVLVLVGSFALGGVGTGTPAEASGAVPTPPADVVRYGVVLLPALGYVFLSLARRGVQRDIALVRSMDRLR